MDQNAVVDEMVEYALAKVMRCLLSVDLIDNACREKGLSLRDNPDYQREEREYFSEVSRILIATKDQVRAVLALDESSGGGEA